jgi:nucleotide-binding universal stress UspA family protein
VSILFKKKKWDRQPTAPAAVLLASDGERGFGSRAVARAAALAGSEPVAVIIIARIYGTKFGLPVPGLMPTKDEIKQRLGWMRTTIQQLEHRGIEADGQIAQTRKPSRTISRVARTRGVRVVVIESHEKSKGRRVIEGDVATEVARALRRAGIEVEIIPRASGAKKDRRDRRAPARLGPPPPTAEARGPAG